MTDTIDWSDMTYMELKRQWKKTKVHVESEDFKNFNLWHLISLIEELMARYEEEDI